MSRASDRPLIPALTSLRFFAAFHVLLAHFARAPAILKVDVGGLPGWFTTFAGGAYWAVSAFFVMSGFVLTYTYADRLGGRGAFWSGRFARIYPAYALSLLILAPQFFLMRIGHEALDWEGQHHGLVAVLVPLLLQSWVPGAAEAWNGVAWTLSVDVACYAVFPFLLGPLARLSSRRLVGVMVLGWLSMLALSALYIVLEPDGVVGDGPGRHGSLFWLAAIRYHPIARFPEFLAGMAAGHLFLRRGPTTERTASALVAAGLAGIALTTLVLPGIPVAFWHSGLIPVSAIALVYGLAARPRWTRALERRPFTRLGDASYGFYLFHVSLVASTLLAFRRFGAPFPGAVLVLLATAVLLSTGAAFLVNRLVEVPARRLLRRRVRRSPP